ncbi:Hypothetical protein SMAX5B_019397 [Scophthalmus maximus]|nr:Hypothetical protein SMAX5B_019397 [Scophthalmus maximus]
MRMRHSDEIQCEPCVRACTRETVGEDAVRSQTREGQTKVCARGHARVLFAAAYASADRHPLARAK